ncbi:Rieske 2Fe-2S domain-containing protein [Rhodococcus sp. (in: high G+C Gram-positive bacteria)]|uniref:Rieske 2Fe-2S domain-containing protein n=1 Tax=Rhodococcus sp. TaxID=1831 RepID=UPI001A0A0325|nr:Rieske 2Fe-2S domain-containing protein [Rhodococcus sp. (in: high G+C Gram-positive bacteria)]MBF0660442.1 nitrite reductase (NAD(P)H) small subunit [Rhodococcus sp. (in: high G+C Gram-positive bacteria)]
MTAVDDNAVVDLGPVSGLTRGEGRTYTVDGRQIAVFLLSDGSVRATDAVCPHKGGPLADGQIDHTGVVCPLHQYAFSFDTGACAAHGIGSVRTYAVQVSEGRILLSSSFSGSQ